MAAVPAAPGREAGRAEHGSEDDLHDTTAAGTRHQTFVQIYRKDHTKSEPKEHCGLGVMTSWEGRSRTLWGTGAVQEAGGGGLLILL